jgi:hypothetical protein
VNNLPRILAKDNFYKPIKEILIIGRKHSANECYLTCMMAHLQAENQLRKTHHVNFKHDDGGGGYPQT